MAHDLRSTMGSRARLHLCVTGSPSLDTEKGTLSVSKPVVFAAALYLCLQRGQPVVRARLAALLWPDADDATRSERQRWIVHQLRRAGVAVPGSSSETLVPAGEIVVDVEELRIANSVSDALSHIHGDVLEGYEPQISDVFSHWLEQKRDTLRLSAIQSLARWLTTASTRGEWGAVEAVAQRILRLDVHHDQANAALVRAALVPQRSSQDVAAARLETSPRTAQQESRSSIDGVDIVSAREAASSPFASGPCRVFVGRDAESVLMAASLDGFWKSTRRLDIAGPSGIGKSRLLEEFIGSARRREVQVALVQCSREDVFRPLSLVIDLAHVLCELPGALGASPDSLATLRSLAQVPFDHEPRETTATKRRTNGGEIFRALAEVMSAVADECPLTVVVDDAQWAERESWPVLSPLFTRQTAGLFCIVICHTADTPHRAGHAVRTTFFRGDISGDQNRQSIWLRPLTRDAIRLQCIARAAPREIPAEVLESLVASAGGLPCLAESLVDHWSSTSEISSPPGSVRRLIGSRLDRMGPDVEHVLAAIGLLAQQATLPAIEAVAMLPRPQLLEATAILEATGALHVENGLLVASQLWTSVVLGRLPATARHFMQLCSTEWLDHQSSRHLEALLTPREHLPMNWFRSGALPVA